MGRRSNVLRYGTLLVFACAVAAAAWSAAGTKLIQFELEDFRKNRYANETWRGRSIAMLLSDREGVKFDENYAWSAPIVAAMRESDAVVVSIADVRGVPKFSRSLVRRMFEPKKADPVGLTLLDWDGVLFTNYGLAGNAYHLLLFDRHHNLVYREDLTAFDAGRLSLVLSRLHDVRGAK